MSGKTAPAKTTPSASLDAVYELLLSSYGEQGWWPIVKKGPCENQKDFSINGWHSHYDVSFKHKKRTSSEAFEISIGAILTQNTNWNNVVKALIHLKERRFLTRKSLRGISTEQLAKLIRPAGYFNQKARKIKEFVSFLDSRRKITRENLLDVWGVGKETADSILLYAHNKPLFVVDAYTRRIFSRLGFFSENEDYDSIQNFFHKNLLCSPEKKSELYNEYHALIVEHAKRHCKARPECTACPLLRICPAAKKWETESRSSGIGTRRTEQQYKTAKKRNKRSPS